MNGLLRGACHRAGPSGPDPLARNDELETVCLTAKEKGRDRSRPLSVFSVSCPAKAGHPVTTTASDRTETPRLTGSSGQAGRRQQYLSSKPASVGSPATT